MGAICWIYATSPIPGNNGPLRVPVTPDVTAGLGLGKGEAESSNLSGGTTSPCDIVTRPDGQPDMVFAAL